MVALSGCRDTSKPLQDARLSKVETQTSEKKLSSLDKPGEPVTDLVGVLNDGDISDITNQIIDLDSLHLAQVAVVVVPYLEGKSVLDFAAELGNKWGVGHKDTNDGITIVIKPKDAKSKGEAAIATGLGMEKLLSNETCNNIINEVMIPEFKQNNYGEGIKKTLGKIKDILTENKE